jgi:hypothetical protein
MNNSCFLTSELLDTRELKQLFAKSLLGIKECSSIMECIIQVEHGLRFLKEQKYILKDKIQLEKKTIMEEIRLQFIEEKRKFLEVCERIIKRFEMFNFITDTPTDPLEKAIVDRINALMTQRIDFLHQKNEKISSLVSQKEKRISDLEEELEKALTSKIIIEGNLKESIINNEKLTESLKELNKSRTVSNKTINSESSSEKESEIEDMEAEEMLCKFACAGVGLLYNKVLTGEIQLKQPTAENLFFKFPLKKWLEPFSELLTEDMKYVWFIDEKNLSLEDSKWMFFIITYISLKLGGRVSIWYGNFLNRKFNGRDYKNIRSSQLISRAQDTFFCWFEENANISFYELATAGKRNTLYSILLRLINNTSVPRFL